ncbi:hypothetical protein ElyMa_001483500 [Elysia marginata]|uniref:Uncharacterized protein n=1 Tax=Elysia marginata TaxID=1093978 RepID=A0AAV4J6C2_9GAST|nr:hypothetical protein ElyMa_001483500 [Elysia marginata]
MTGTLEDYIDTVNIEEPTITNLRSADDIDGQESGRPNKLDLTSSRFDMEISDKKTKLLMNTVQLITTKSCQRANARIIPAGHRQTGTTLDLGRIDAAAGI